MITGAVIMAVGVLLGALISHSNTPSNNTNNPAKSAEREGK
jgi:hypothetical protein